VSVTSEVADVGSGLRGAWIVMSMMGLCLWGVLVMGGLSSGGGVVGGAASRGVGEATGVVWEVWLVRAETVVGGGRGVLVCG